jgi:predicted ATPase/DNA-binding SARP family transcriptional activator
LEFRVLGPLEVVVGDERLALGPPQQRAVLAMLLIHAGEVVSTDRLVDALWGETPPPSARQALRLYVSRLRRIMKAEPSVLMTMRPGYTLATRADQVDAARFERALAEARATDDPATVDLVLGEALALWRGPAYADSGYAEFAAVEIRRLEELHLEAADRQVAAQLQLGRHGEVLGRLEQLVADNPLRESLRASQMLALYRSGRQAEALRVFQEARRLLGEELGIEPGEELRRLEEQILLHDAALAAVPAFSRHNLPTPAAGFVGRAQELTEVSALVGSRRIVTVTGPPGVGKTRLALEVAAGFRGHFKDGAWLVDLSALTEPGLLASSVAAVLGVQEGTALVDRIEQHLRDRHLLLLLDNCEHLIDGVAELIARFVPRAPGVHVLATSREVLRVDGEYHYPLAPMAVPAPDLAPAATATYDVVQLFHQRAVAAHPAFRFDSDTAPAVVRVCARLDGIPLAIELAAAKASALPVTEIADGLDHRFRLLDFGVRGAPLHHRTLEEAVAWSYELASPIEQEHFRKLSVFSGGFIAEDASAVIADGDTDAGVVVETLSSLVDKSLLTVDTHAAGGIRYRSLETIREYGRGRLDVAGEGDATRRHHAEHFLGLTVSATARQDGPEQVKWVRRLTAEHDNLRAALRWCVDSGEIETGLRLGAALGTHWIRHGDWNEGREWLSRLLGVEADVPDEIVGAALGAAGKLALRQNDLDEADGLLREGIRLLRAAGDLDGTANILNTLATLSVERGDLGGARRLYLEAVDIKAATGTSDLPMVINLGWLTLEDGDLAAAEVAFERARAEAAATDADAEAWAIHGLGTVAWLRHDLATAARHFDHGVEAWEALDSRPTMVYGYVGQALVRRARGQVAAAADKALAAVDSAIDLGGGERYAFALGTVVSVAAAAGRWAETARLGAALLALADKHGWHIWSWYRGHLDTCLDEAHSHLGAQATAAAEAGGAAMTLGDALRYAVAEARRMA